VLSTAQGCKAAHISNVKASKGVQAARHPSLLS
jgi:hypothetical protein